MKGRLLALSLILTVIMGCSASDEHTKIEDNVFSSTQLFVKVKVSDDFKYIGSAEQISNSYFHHIFVDCDGVRIKRGIIMEGRYLLPSVSKTGRWYYSGNPFKDLKGLVDLGEIELNNSRYYYCTRPLKLNKDSPVLKYIISKWYLLPDSTMMKWMTRIINGNDEYSITYFEDIDHIGVPVDSWRGMGDLTDSQKGYLNNFNERFLASMEFIKDTQKGSPE